MVSMSTAMQRRCYTRWWREISWFPMSGEPPGRAPTSKGWRLGIARIPSCGGSSRCCTTSRRRWTATGLGGKPWRRPSTSCWWWTTQLAPSKTTPPCFAMDSASHIRVDRFCVSHIIMWFPSISPYDYPIFQFPIARLSQYPMDW